MKNKKIILLILVMLLFSGCTVKYDLFINEDLTVNERVTASEGSNSLKTKTGREPKTVADTLYNFYKIDGVKYSFSTVENSNSITSTASTSFNTLEDYQEYFTSDIVKGVNVTRDGDYITIEYKQDVPLQKYSSKSLLYDQIEVNLEVPFKVIEHNADSVKRNTYTWNIYKDGNLKEIKIKFNTKETNGSKVFNFGFFEINVKYTVLVVVGIVLVLLTIVTVVYINNKKNNRF